MSEMKKTCEVCGCPPVCPICDDANAGLVNDIDRLQQERDKLQVDRQAFADEIERLQRYPEALKQIREERKPGCIIPQTWYWLLKLLDRIDELVDDKAAEAAGDE